VPPGVTTRWHHLEDITEHYVVTEGLGRVEVGTRPPREVHPGDVVRIPPGVRQRITNIGPGDLVFLAVCAPRFRQDSYRSH
jgi:mannose-6-phosphate isomerase-like protein (cupin superfamily)